MLNELARQVLFNPKVIAAIDIFNSIKNAGTSLKNNLTIISGIIAVVSIIAGGLMFFFGRRGADNGKSHITNVLMGVFLILGAASLITSLFGIFGQTASGI